jgi:hypothetical protein
MSNSVVAANYGFCNKLIGLAGNIMKGLVGIFGPKPQRDFKEIAV